MGHFFEKPVIWKFLTALFLITSVGLMAALIRLSTKSDEARISHSEPVIQRCSAGMPQGNKQPKSQGLFDDLSFQEVTAVRDYMLAQRSLALSPFDKATVSSNYIYGIQFLPPPKDAALEFLDNNGAKPEREAVVIVFLGASDLPRAEEYIVWPAAQPKQHKLRVVEGQRHPIPFDARPFDLTIEYNAVDKMIGDISVKMDKILRDSYDSWSHRDCAERCLILGISAPMGFTGYERTSWFYFYRNLPGHYLYPINTAFYVNHTGPDPAKWSILKVLYNSQTFDSVNDLIKEDNEGKLKRTFVPAPRGDEALFSTYQRRGKSQPAKPMRGPEPYEPDGERYTVNGRHVEYMSWAFDFRVDSNFGMQIFDISFNSERIIYELSLQEAVATYGGSHPYQYWNNFLDGNWGMGRKSSELTSGIDCPSSATYFDLIHLLESGEPARWKRAVCVFEQNTGIPLRRHYDFPATDFNFYGGMSNHALIIRTISAVYNYDYVFDYVFYQNGVIEVRVSTTGYVYGTFYTPPDSYPYAYPLHANFLTSAVHDHLLSYKVDLDVGGRKNSYETIEVAIENISDPWLPGMQRIKKILKREIKTRELDAAYKFNFDRPKYLNFINEAQKNKMNITKGYRIQLDNILKQLYPEDWIMTPMFSWSLYQLAITKHKKNETRSSSVYNQQSPTVPQVDFRKFLEDNDGIRNEDLVAWVTIGGLHVPHSEDVPNTATAGNTARFFIRPFNYFDEDPSMGSTNAVLIKPGGNGLETERYGTPEKSSCFPNEDPVDNH